MTTDPCSCLCAPMQKTASAFGCGAATSAAMVSCLRQKSEQDLIVTDIMKQVGTGKDGSREAHGRPPLRLPAFWGFRSLIRNFAMSCHLPASRSGSFLEIWFSLGRVYIGQATPWTQTAAHGSPRVVGCTSLDSGAATSVPFKLLLLHYFLQLG